MATVTQQKNACGTETRECFSFTLLLTGFDEITPEIENALFDAGCNDAMLGIHAGTPYLAFDREADSLEEAIKSAIKNVEEAGQNIEVVRVIPPGADTIELVNAFLRMRRQLHQQLSREGKAPAFRKKIDDMLCALMESDPDEIEKLLKLNNKS